MRTRIRAIFFDLGETLVTQNIEDNIVTKRALEELAGILPKPLSGTQLYGIYKRGYRINHTIRSSHHVEIPVQTWMRELLEQALDREPPGPLVNKAIGIIVKTRAENAVAIEDAKPVLDRLAKRGIRLGIISNVSSHEVALQILKHVSLYTYFEHVVTSAQTGIRKPDPGIFLYALSQFGLKPEETVHVGDSEVHDVRGAKPVGITTVLIRDARDSLASDADYRFRSLKEAAGLLESL